MGEYNVDRPNMQSISDSDFLAWAAEAGLVPDPRYPQSRPQLVFTNCPDGCGVWDTPRTPGELTKFVDTVISLIGDGLLRVRLRGGGVLGFTVAEMEGERGAERSLRAAAVAVGIPADTRGALEFDRTERQVLLDLAIAFLSFGYCIGTDLEIVASDRGVCLMLSHHHELIGQFASRDRRSAFDKAMTAAGYVDQAEEKDEYQRIS